MAATDAFTAPIDAPEMQLVSTDLLVNLAASALRCGLRSVGEQTALLRVCGLLDRDPVARALCAWVDMAAVSWVGKPCALCGTTELPVEAADRCLLCTEDVTL